MNACWNFPQCCSPMMSDNSKKKKYKYVPPPRTESCRPRRTYDPTEHQMDDRTVYSMSYTSANIKEDDINRTPCQSNFFQPQCSSICPFFSTGPLWNASCEQTVPKVSRPAGSPSKRNGLQKKPRYVPPMLTMEDQTVQKLSYGPPGEFVECTDDESDCRFCPPMLSCFPTPPCNSGNMCCNSYCQQEPVCENNPEIVYLY